MFDRRFLTHFDWRIFATAVGLALLSVLTIYSANRISESAFRRGLYLRQLTWVGLGLVALAVACFANYRSLGRFAYVFYGLALASVALVLVIGRIGQGAQRWIRLGPLAFQPSEFVKLALVMTLARYLDDHRDELRTPRAFLLPAALTLVPAALVLKQPDLGTAVILVLIGLAMMSMVGLRLTTLIPFAVGGLAATPILWGFLKDYQRRRILVFLNPQMDPLGAGYHVAQSKIAVGSGGVFGKGWVAASQSQLNFLPENHTDFIFAVVAEQWGFLGSLLLLLAYFYLISKGLQIAKDAKDMYAALLAFGIVGILTFQLLINVGMVTGIMPVVGIPLPLLSYGGSSMLVTMSAVGLLLNIQMRRFLY